MAVVRSNEELNKYAESKAPLTGTGASGTWEISVTGNAATATKLSTARTLSLTGDVSYSVSFDGSGNVTAAATLSNTGVTAGTYTKLTVDAKGRITAGTTLAATDVPALDTGKLTTGILPVVRGGTGVGTSTGTGNAVLSTAPTFNRLVSVGNGNNYNQGGVEILGNGATDTIYPTLGFNQPSLYAGTIQLRTEGDFKFYKQGNVLGNIGADIGTFATSVTAPTFNGNATSATGAKYQTAGTGATCAEKFNNTPAHSTSFSECNNVADAPNTGWWLIYSVRHSNSSNYWGTQIAYGFSNNANQIWQRNIDNGAWSAWRASSFVYGMIMIWSGSAASIPVGWALCNGANGTPNLQDRFVIGAGSGYGVGATGGRTDAIVPSHQHHGWTTVNGAHTHHKQLQLSDAITSGEQNTISAGGGLIARYWDFDTDWAGDHQHEFNTDWSGESNANQNLPPFYALCYIMKI